MTTPRDPIYAGHRYPAEIISYAVWLYFRFPLSLRMVEEMLAARGISVTHETIRQWGLKFGREFANRIRRRAPRRGYKWHLDEVVISVAGKKHWLWRAVDQDGFVLDVLVQSRRDKEAAKRLFRKLLKRQGRAPRVLVTDKLKSYAAAKREIMPGVEHRQHKDLNNRAENSHQPIRPGKEGQRRFLHDSPLEEAGFELPVPPERKAALDRVRRPSVTRRQAYPHRATRGGSVVKRTAETAAKSDPFARRSAVKKRFCRKESSVSPKTIPSIPQPLSGRPAI
jgi:putative transposase